jgi:hypothetical protein
MNQKTNLRIAWAMVAAIVLFCVFKVKLYDLFLFLMWLPSPLPIFSEAQVKALRAVFSVKFWLPGHAVAAKNRAEAR